MRRQQLLLQGRFWYRLGVHTSFDKLVMMPVCGLRFDAMLTCTLLVDVRASQWSTLHHWLEPRHMQRRVAA